MPDSINTSLTVPPPLSINEPPTLTYKDVTDDGKVTTITVPLPTTAAFAEWNLSQQIGMLKTGMWEKESIPNIIWGLAYAHRIGADPMLGELFPTGKGRWGVSNGYRIRMAKNSPRYNGHQVVTKELSTPLDPKLGCKLPKDLECTATVWVKNWDHPITVVHKLSDWYKGSNAYWKQDPRGMLENNTLGHACKFVPSVSMVDDDEVTPPTIDAEIVSSALDDARLLATTKEPK